MNANKQTNIKTVAEVRSHYAGLRSLVYQAVAAEFVSLNVTLKEISYTDAISADRWIASWSDTHKRPIWSWVDMYHNYQNRNELKRFDVAVVAQGETVALCYGRPSREKMLLKIHTIARKPYGNPLAGQTLDIILYAAGLYADLLGSAEIWLVQPMNEALVAIYERHGYLAQRNKMGKVTHMSMRLSDET